jgi:hypothetical protein
MGVANPRPGLIGSYSASDELGSFYNGNNTPNPKPSTQVRFDVSDAKTVEEHFKRLAAHDTLIN